MFAQAIAHHRAGRVAQATALYRKILKQAPRHADSWQLLGAAAHGLGNLDEAERHLRAALEIDPAHGPAYYYLARVLTDQDRPAEAVRAAKQAVTLDPRNLAAGIALAVAQRQSGAIDDAIALLSRIVAAAPHNADAANALGNCQRDKGEHNAALTQFRRAAALKPSEVRFQYNSATCLKALGRGDEALPILQNIADALPEARARAAEILLADKRIAEASAEARRGLAKDGSGQCAGVLVECLIVQGKAEEAQKIARRMKGGGLFATLAQGRVAALLGEHESALRAFRKAVDIAPGNDQALFNAGIHALAHGCLAEGWAGYEARFRHRPQAGTLPYLALPRWQGETSDEPVLVWGEQGLGDEILHASMLGEMAARAPVVLACSPRLVGLFQRSFPEITVIAQGQAPNGAANAPRRQIPLASLGGHFRPDLASFPDRHGYLRAESALAETLRQRYSAQGRPVIGLSWKSVALTGQTKSTALRDWVPLLDQGHQAGARFISLQYGDIAADLAEIQEHFGIEIFADPQIDASGDMEPYAAQIAACDLVISVSNSAAHFAGALNVPCWTLIPFAQPLWYWFLSGDTSPWYPAMRLFRQEKGRLWQDALGRIAQALPGWIGSAQSPR